MTYYILLPGDTENNLSDANMLGESSFGTFWSGQGLKVLMKMVDKQPELLESITIKTDQNKTITVAEFLFNIKDLIVRY
jgi:hypothetical protein